MKKALPTRKRARAILAELCALGSPKDRAGMARYGINVQNAFGVSIYELREVAKRLGTDHDLALALWATGNHEARLRQGPGAAQGLTPVPDGNIWLEFLVVT
jgi:3-methyladenine DNA glycosylase AlkD